MRLSAWTCQLWSVQRSEPDYPPPADLMWMGTASLFTAITCSHVASTRRTGKVLGGRTLLLLHDTQGHPHLATTHRGDFHLTKGVPQFLARYDQATGGHPVTRLIIDRSEWLPNSCTNWPKRGARSSRS